jgi:hypothetical protein
MPNLQDDCSTILKIRNINWLVTDRAHSPRESNTLHCYWLHNCPTPKASQLPVFIKYRGSSTWRYLHSRHFLLAPVYSEERTEARTLKETILWCKLWDSAGKGLRSILEHLPHKVRLHLSNEISTTSTFWNIQRIKASLCTSNHSNRSHPLFERSTILSSLGL